MIDYIVDIINAVLYWLEGYLALFTIAVPKNKNPLFASLNKPIKNIGSFPDNNFFISLTIFFVIVLFIVLIKVPLNNSNSLGDKVTPTFKITKHQIEKYKLIDLPKVLNYIQSVDITQSGPTGQQGSVFLRGTNSNHTLVLLNGIPINDYSTPTGAYDVGPEFMFNVQQINVYKGSAGAHWGADAVGGAINFITTVDLSLIHI